MNSPHINTLTLQISLSPPNPPSFSSTSPPIRIIFFNDFHDLEGPPKISTSVAGLQNPDFLPVNFAESDLVNTTHAEVCTRISLLPQPLDTVNYESGEGEATGNDVWPLSPVLSSDSEQHHQKQQHRYSGPEISKTHLRPPSSTNFACHNFCDIGRIAKPLPIQPPCLRAVAEFCCAHHRLEHQLTFVKDFQNHQDSNNTYAAW